MAGGLRPVTVRCPAKGPWGMSSAVSRSVGDFTATGADGICVRLTRVLASETMRIAAAAAAVRRLRGTCHGMSVAVCSHTVLASAVIRSLSRADGSDTWARLIRVSSRSYLESLSFIMHSFPIGFAAFPCHTDTDSLPCPGAGPETWRCPGMSFVCISS